MGYYLFIRRGNEKLRLVVPDQEKEISVREEGVRFDLAAGTVTISGEGYLSEKPGDKRKRFDLKENSPVFARSEKGRMLAEFILCGDGTEELYEPDRKKELTGREEFITSGGLSFWISREENEYVLMSDAYGHLLVNGFPAEKRQRLGDCDWIQTPDFQGMFYGGALYFKRGTVRTDGDLAASPSCGTSYPEFIRGPVPRTVIPEARVRILPPGAAPGQAENRLLQTLLPSAAMMGVLIFAGAGMGGSMILISACSAGAGLLSAGAGALLERHARKKAAKRRETVYRNYLERKKQEILDLRQAERAALSARCRSCEENLKRILTFSPDLFREDPEDRDALFGRMGVGTVPSRVEVLAEETERLEPGDSLEDAMRELACGRQVLADAPFALPLLREKYIGVTGDRALCRDRVKAILAGLMASVSPESWLLWQFRTEDAAGEGALYRFAPFCETEGKFLFAAAPGEREQLLNFLYEQLSEEHPGRIHVIFADALTEFRNHPAAELLKKCDGNAVCIFSAETNGLLPQETRLVIEAGARDRVLFFDGRESLSYLPDPVDVQTFYRALRFLSPVRISESREGGKKDRAVSFPELFGLTEGESFREAVRWKEGAGSLKIPIGKDDKGELVCLDLDEKADGPHGLIAGTTGSGKSALLETLVLSASLCCSPEQLAFFIIDFKGGGLSGRFRALPHLAGTISNIDGKTTARALLTVQAEIRRREKLFADLGVNHIDLYQAPAARKGYPVLPHLVILVDEFAELKSAFPSFMDALISAARVGRSLGIHLILATQKPSGTVNGQILGNMHFRICMKVQDAGESREVLKTPIAASIRTPGTGYLQTGNNERFLLFRAGYAGGRTAGDGETAFDRALAAVKESYAARASAKEMERLVFLPPLPSDLPFQAPEKGIFAAGMIDDPENQRAETLALDFRENILITGGRFGKTSFLKLAMRLAGESDSGIRVYGLDAGRKDLQRFSVLPFCGGVVFPDAPDSLRYFLDFLEKEIRRGKEAEERQILVLIDRLDLFSAACPDRFERLMELVRSAAERKVCFIATAGSPGAVGYRYLSLFPLALSLYEESRDPVYGSASGGLSEAVPGRVTLQKNGKTYAAQIFRPFDSPEYEAAWISRMAEKAGYAEKIPEMPEKILRDEYPVPENAVFLGLNYEDLEPVYWRKKQRPVLFFCQADGKMREKVMNILTEAPDTEVTVVGPEPEKAARQLEKLDRLFQEEYTEYLNGTYRKKRDRLLVLEHAEILEQISESRESLAAFERLLKKYARLSVSLVVTDFPNEPIRYSAPEAFRLVKERGTCLSSIGPEKIRFAENPAGRRIKYEFDRETDCFYLEEEKIIRIRF